MGPPRGAVQHMPGAKLWQACEDAQLEKLFEELQPGEKDPGGWKALAARLSTEVAVRSGKAAQNQALRLGLRDQLKKNSARNGWAATRQPEYRPLKKDPKRAAAAAERSPVGPLPDPPAQKQRRLAADAANQPRKVADETPRARRQRAAAGAAQKALKAGAEKPTLKLSEPETRVRIKAEFKLLFTPPRSQWHETGTVDL